MSGTPLALVVEDSADQRDLLRRHLDREGYEVIAAPDAESAIALFDEIDPALAVVDLFLPGISGEEFVRVIRERFPDCFLIVSSVLDAVDYPPVDAVLPKPVTGAVLREVIGRARR